ncbi:MAG: hypothetical protein LBV62_02690 [Rickettsiales bacterium]|jgi:hypothetical protein|nr:hypothetical protein [Rickettsiales bacterium]
MLRAVGARNVQCENNQVSSFSVSVPTPLAQEIRSDYNDAFEYYINFKVPTE